MNGATERHLQFWDGMLARFIILDFDSKAARQAAAIVAQLKTKRKTIDKPDLFIAGSEQFGPGHVEPKTFYTH